MSDTAVSIALKDMVVNLCDTYVTHREHKRRQKVMIFNPGAPRSLVGRHCLKNFIVEIDGIIKDMVTLSCY